MGPEHKKEALDLAKEAIKCDIKSMLCLCALGFLGLTNTP